MAFYTVLTPPDAASHTEGLEKAVFLKDGFVITAFIFTGLWLLSQRLWLWAAVFLGVWVAIGFGGPMLGLHPLSLAVAQGVIGLFLGLEGNALIERRLTRKGWTLAGVVEGATLDTVERRFFEAAGKGQPSSVAMALARLAPQQAPPAPASQAVVGLFPDPSGLAR